MIDRSWLTAGMNELLVWTNGKMNGWLDQLMGRCMVTR